MAKKSTKTVESRAAKKPAVKQDTKQNIVLGIVDFHRELTRDFH